MVQVKHLDAGMDFRPHEYSTMVCLGLTEDTGDFEKIGIYIERERERERKSSDRDRDTHTMGILP